MKRVATICLLLMLASGGAAARECVGLRTLQSSIPKAPSLMASIRALLGSSKGGHLPPCSAINGVLGKMNNQAVPGGTGLEPKQAFNPAAAQTNLSKALADPAIKARLTELQGPGMDEDTRLFFEAALFEDEGFYGARDLRVQQLRERLGAGRQP